MDSKLKIKYRKDEKKYVLDYSKVVNIEDTRFEVYENLNQKEAIMVLIDTSLNIADPKKIQKCYYNLKDEGSYTIINNYLEESEFEYRIKRVRRNVPRTILGFTTSKSDLVEDVLVATFIPIGKLTREFFDYLLCTHDVMVGIKPIKPISSVLRDFSSGQFQRIDEIDSFDKTLVDSHWMSYCYTDFEFEF